jgi:ribonuclease R
MLKNASDLADILSTKRESRGSIDLDVKESKITVKNNRVEVSHNQRNKAHKLIEEFMIVANETVAEYAYYLDIPFLYRIHEKPTEEKISLLMEFLKGLGRPQKWHSDNVYPKDFQTLLNKLKGQDDPTFPLINRVMLRSMQKAKYSDDNIGHFGLSSKCYCHFTSPIRRYPDLVVHRVLKSFFKGEDVHQKYADFVSKASVHSGEKEKSAELAERAVDDYYKMLYMSDYIGYEFTGIISGVQSFGIFVELPSTVEGIVKIDTIRGKGFEFDAKNYKLYNAKRSFKLGQTVDIVVVGVDLANRRAEFMLKDDYLYCK